MRHIHQVQRLDFSAMRPSASDGHPTATGILVADGCAEVALERRFSVCAGDLYVIPAGARHSFHGALSPQASGWVFDLGTPFDFPNNSKAVARLEESRAADLRSWLNRIMMEQSNRDACSRALCESLTRALQIECARAVGVGACNQQSRVVAEALQIISAEYATVLRPGNIAARIGITPTHLSHEVRRQTGRSPSQWIMHARVEAAKSMLIATHCATATVAEAVGYSDVSQLNRTFRQLTGTSPAAWRSANGARNSTN